MRLLLRLRWCIISIQIFGFGFMLRYPEYQTDRR